MDRTVVLRCSAVSMWNESTRMLDQVTWEVSSGEHWVVLGSNGSGKTSLLGAITAYATPSLGEIDLLGHRYGTCDWRELRRRVGVVSSAIHVHLHSPEPAVRTVASGKKAAFGLWSVPDEGDLARAAELLDALGAAHVGERPWRVLSQGERQRVLIARALMADPDLLLLDEPCAGLDPIARERLLERIRDLARAPRPTLILVTHHVEEVVPVFTHALLLRQGRVVAAGPMEDALTSETLSRAFDHEVTLRRRGDRYELGIEPGPLVAREGRVRGVELASR
jgi:iron complex transport system ATP-binding protein